MIRRITVVAVLAAVVVLAAAVSVWHWYVNAMGSTMATQTAAARILLDAGQTHARALVEALMRPSIHIVIEDRANAMVYDARAGNVTERPLPPGGIPPMPAEEDLGRARSERAAPANEFPPPNQPPPGRRPPQPRGPLTQFAGQLAGLHPQRLENGPLVVHVTPDADELGRFLVIDTLTTFLILVGIAGTGIYLVSSISRKARERLEALVEERRAAAAEYQRFLADAGHELRTPLTIVSGYVDILSSRADESDPQMKRLFEGMQAETARMRALVEKMLLLARLETPVAVPRLVDVAAVAEDAANSMRAKYGGRAISVSDGDRASIVIDQDDLYEALHNLIENALKYAPGSDVAVETGIAGGRAYARVTDHGPGIPASERDAVFRRFYRGEGRSDSDGSGLGLAIVARVADRWHGTVDLASSARETAFTLTFPLADEEPHVVAR